MQDMIQLNGAIYRLNVAAATPANRSHMSGTLRQSPTNPSPSLSGSVGRHVYDAQILSQPLQPLRTPRPSWTVRRDDAQNSNYGRQQPVPQQPMHPPRSARIPQQQQPLHPAPVPPRLMRPQQQQPSANANNGAIVYSQQLTNAKPLDPTVQLQNAQREHATVPNAPITINTAMAAVSAGTDTPDGGGASTARTWAASRKGASPRSPYSGGHEGQQMQQQQQQQQKTVVGERTPRYAAAGQQSTYRSRNSAHVEVDELPFVRPTQTTWAGNGSQQQQQQQQHGGGPAGQMPRRRSAVVEVFDDSSANPEA
ncbi:hypothetical protein H4S06_005463, partial [Coemansia sp. BCRC 34490]